MNATPFDTLRLATDLEKSGFTTEQSKGLTGALAAAMGSTLVTKSDLDAGLLATGTALQSKIDLFRTELREEIATVRTELKGDIASVRTELKDLENRMTLRMGGMIAAAVGILVAVDKLI